MTERAIEAAARPLRWKLADAISFAVTGTYGHASDYLVEADAALSVIAALAEDDAAVEKVAEVFLTEARQLQEMMALAASTFLERAQAQVALNSLRLEQTKAQARQYARAAIRALGE